MRHARTVAAHVHVHQRIPDAVFLVAIGPDHASRPARLVDPGRRAEFAAHPLRAPGSGLQHLKCGSVSSGRTRSTLPSVPTLAPQAYWPMGCWVQMTRRPPLACGHSKLGRPNRACTSASGVPGATWARLAQADRAQGARRQGDAGRFVMKCHILLPRRRKGAPGAPVGQFYRISYNRRALSRHPFRMMPNRAGGSGGGPGQEPGFTSLCRQQ